MSTPKRAAKKTATTKTAAAAGTRLASSKAKKSSVKKTVKTAVKKTASTSKAAVKTATKKITAAARPRLGSASASTASVKAKKAAKKVVKKATAAAQKVAKKVAKIISKVVAKKRAAAKPQRAAAATAGAKKTARPKPSAASTGVSKKTARPRQAAAAVGGAKKAPTLRRPKTFPAHEAKHAFGFPADAPELPDTYGEDRLVLMTKDPEYLFAYWELTPGKLAAGHKAKRRGEDYREALRLNWASRDIFERNFAVLPISLTSRKWYLRVPFSGLAYQVEIGWLGESGHFVSLLTSNPSDAPESWNATRRRLKHAAEGGGVLGRALAAGSPQGSSDLSASAGGPGAAPGPLDWNFTGPGSQTSSFGSSGKAKKAARRPAAS